MNTTKRKPYGLWTSPFSAEARAERVRFTDLRWDGSTGNLLWVERGSQGTRLVCKPNGGAGATITADFEIGGGVAYGGGDFDARGGKIAFVDHGSQLFYLDVDKGVARAITPEMGAVASPALSPDGQRVAFVVSDGEDDALYVVETRGLRAPVRLAWGADFYMDPVWHPDGTRLAWVEWNHPDMPWDSAKIVLADLSGDQQRIVHARTIVGGSGKPAVQPAFSPDGSWLSCLASDGEWDQLVAINLVSGERKLPVQGAGVVLAPPSWVQGIRTYGWYADSRQLACLSNREGVAGLSVVDLDGRTREIDLAGYNWANQLAVAQHSGEIALIASGSARAPAVICLDSRGIRVEVESGPNLVPLEYFAPALPFHWPAPDGGVVHGLYYPPTNPDYVWDGLPPAVLRVHSGPTMQAVAEFNEEAQYFTSRGFAWLEVNYRGSTGYGRSYQQALNDCWGELDVQDTVSAADGLIADHLADGERLALYGSSAGGFTVLNTLIRHPSRFRAAVDAYGVSNLFKLDEDTHKFERYANARLIGPLPQAEQKYNDWSPEFHADSIRDALAIFQGEEDRVVPRSQSDAIVTELRRNGVPHLYRLYAGEGHRFRKRETRLDFIQSMERFLLEHLILTN